jgi:hypothetical protein
MLRLGKKPASEDARDLRLTTYAKLPAAPTSFGHATALRRNSWLMLGNDEYGDCVWAGADHEHMLWTKLGKGTHTPFTAQNALSDYTDCTGFQPDEPQSDQGTDMRDAAKYRQKTGVVDRAGRRHKIGAYLFLDAGDWAQLRQALYLFECVGVGIEFPDSAMDQFDEGDDWDVVKGAQVEGGHYIPAIGAHDKDHIHVVTWGRRIQMSSYFYETYADEAVVYLTDEDLKAGRSPEGLDLAQLQDDLKQL